MTNKLIDVKELAIHLGLTEFYVRKLARDNNIPSYKLGREFRFKLEEVLESLKYEKEGN